MHCLCSLFVYFLIALKTLSLPLQNLDCDKALEKDNNTVSHENFLESKNISFTYIKNKKKLI